MKKFLCKQIVITTVSTRKYVLQKNLIPWISDVFCVGSEKQVRDFLYRLRKSSLKKRRVVSIKVSGQPAYSLKSVCKVVDILTERFKSKGTPKVIKDFLKDEFGRTDAIIKDKPKSVAKGNTDKEVTTEKKIFISLNKDDLQILAYMAIINKTTPEAMANAILKKGLFEVKTFVQKCVEN